MYKRQLQSLIIGLAMGGTILIGQYVGARREKDAEQTISTILTMFIILGALFTVGILIFCDPLLRLMQTPAEAFDSASAYVRVIGCGIIFSFGYNALSAILRGLGDSTRPLLFVAVACVTNMVLDYLMVGPLNMGAGGAALATIISQALSVALAILYLRRIHFPFDFRPSSFRLHRDKAAGLLKLGIPVCMQETLVSLSFLIIIAIINGCLLYTSKTIGHHHIRIPVRHVPRLDIAGKIVDALAGHQLMGLLIEARSLFAFSSDVQQAHPRPAYAHDFFHVNGTHESKLAQVFALTVHVGARVDEQKRIFAAGQNRSEGRAVDALDAAHPQHAPGQQRAGAARGQRGLGLAVFDRHQRHHHGAARLAANGQYRGVVHADDLRSFPDFDAFFYVARAGGQRLQRLRRTAKQYS